MTVVLFSGWNSCLLAEFMRKEWSTENQEFQKKETRKWTAKYGIPET